LIVHQAGQIAEQRRNGAGLATTAADDAVELAHTLGRCGAPFGQLLVQRQLIRLKGLTHNGKQKGTPAMPGVARDGITEELRSLQGSAESGLDNRYGGEMGRMFGSSAPPAPLFLCGKGTGGSF